MQTVTAFVLRAFCRAAKVAAADKTEGVPVFQDLRVKHPEKTHSD